MMMNSLSAGSKGPQLPSHKGPDLGKGNSKGPDIGKGNNSRGQSAGPRPKMGDAQGKIGPNMAQGPSNSKGPDLGSTRGKDNSKGPDVGRSQGHGPDHLKALLLLHKAVDIKSPGQGPNVGGAGRDAGKGPNVGAGQGLPVNLPAAGDNAPGAGVGPTA